MKYSFNYFLFMLIGMLFTNNLFSQSIYFINRSNRVVNVSRRTILEIGSYPYTFTKDSTKLQSIPLQTFDPAIYNVIMTAANGSFDSNMGRYYLLKPNDTIILTSQNSNLHLTHQSSALRTRELMMGEKLMENLPVKPLYTLPFDSLMSLGKTTLPIARRDRIIDSMSIPIINYIDDYCRTNHIDPEIEKLYKYNFTGMRYFGKINPLESSTNVVYAEKMGAFYKDSVAKWANEFTCNNCSNIPLYNLAAKATFNLLYKRLTPIAHLNAIAKSTTGNTRDFLLSVYMADLMENDMDKAGEMMAIYSKLCENPNYKKVVKDNLMSIAVKPKTAAKGLARLITADKKQLDFNEMLKANKGKIIYVDFWASWCGPCLAEIPYSLKLSGKIKNQPVTMVYISTDTDFDSWASMAKARQINGSNSYILANAGKDGLSKMLGLGAIPRYLIIGKDGKFINTNASRPSETQTYMLLKELAGKQHHH